MVCTRTKAERQFPLKKLEALVKIAVDNNLSLLEVGDVKIVPVPRPFSPAFSQDTLYKKTEAKIGRPLTDREKEDEALFGPGGSIVSEYE